MRSKRPGRRKARVQVPGGVGGGQHQDAFVRCGHPVQLGQELVDQLAARALAHVGAVGGQRVHLVEEKHARRVGARHLEHLVQVLLALAQVHVEHVMDAHGHEIGLHLAGGGARQVGLAAAGRTVKKDAAADLLAVGAVDLRMFQGMDDLEVDLFFQLLHAAHVGESDVGLFHGAGGIGLPRNFPCGAGPFAVRSAPSGIRNVPIGVSRKLDAQAFFHGGIDQGGIQIQRFAVTAIGFLRVAAFQVGARRP